MAFDRIVEAIIKEDLERGKFDNLPGRGSPLTDRVFWDTGRSPPGKFRAQNAGMTSHEVELLKEIAELRQILAALLDEKKNQQTERQIQQKQVEFSLMMERQNACGGRSKICQTGRIKSRTGSHPSLVLISQGWLYKSSAYCYTSSHWSWLYLAQMRH
jgi:hypothetical protein